MASQIVPADDPSRISRRGLISLAVLGAGLGVVSYRLVKTAPQVTGETLDPPQAHAKAVAGDITLIDIRRPDEWHRTGVPEGAVPIDMRRADFTTALAEVAGTPGAGPIALICARGVRSARLAKKLGDAGYVRIIDVPEGMLGSASGPGWLARGLPTQPFEEISQ